MTVVFWHPAARGELIEAANFYEREASGLGAIFLDQVEQSVERLEAHPRSARAILDEIRQYLVPRFPYGIVYRLSSADESDRLYILAVAHLKRRPRYWTERA